MMLCEVASWYKSKNMTLWDAMVAMYEKYGFFKEGLETITSTGLPSSNVLYYELEDHGWCCVRPSGTEPKIKFYFGVKGNSLEESEQKLENLRIALMKMFDA